MSNAAREVFDKHGRLFQQEEVIFKDGSIGEAMYIIQKGSVRITKEVMGVDKELAIIRAPDFFGEMSIIDKESRSANAIANEDDTHLIVCDREVFEHQICKNPKFAIRIMKKLSARLRGANRRVATLLQKNDKRKVLCHLITMCEESEPQAGRHNISRRAIILSMQAGFGVDAEASNEALQMLEKVGLATVDGDQMLLKSIDDLQKFLSYLEMKERFKDI